MQRLIAFFKSKVGMAALVVFGVLLLTLLVRNRLTSKEPTATTPAVTATDQATQQQTVDASTDAATVAPAAQAVTTTTGAQAATPPTPPAPSVPPVPTPPANQGPTWNVKYLVHGGDTLGIIAARHHTTAQEIYNHNKATIDAWAKSHHYPVGPNPMNNIFVDEPLILPG